MRGKFMMRPLLVTLVLAATLGACTSHAPSGPITAQDNDLTHGNVQMQVQVGETTQAEILQAFGAPNVTTIDGDGQEVWSYQRAATVTQDSANYSAWSILLAGAGSASSGFEQTSRMTTLILKFDERDVVTDFRSRSSNF